jgi:hypothetical protein
MVDLTLFPYLNLTLRAEQPATRALTECFREKFEYCLVQSLPQLAAVIPCLDI